MGLPVGPRRPKITDGDMGATCPMGLGDLLARLHQLTSLFVWRHLPPHLPFGCQGLGFSGHESASQIKAFEVELDTGDARTNNLSSGTLGLPNQTGKPHRRYRDACATSLHQSAATMVTGLNRQGPVKQAPGAPND